MSKSNRLILPLFFIFTVLTMISCGEDRWAEYKPYTDMDEWLDSTMRNNYYFAADMPKTKNLNYFNTPSTFLSNVRSSYDKVSSIDTIANITDSYGITATFYARSDTDSLYNAVVTYVDTDSPAAQAGLKRGDWIMKVNGEHIATSNKSKLLVDGIAKTLSLGNYTRVIKGTDTTYVVESSGTTLNMAASTTVNDNPVHYYTTLTQGSSKIAYLVYGSFTAGNNGAYNEKLKQAFAAFKSAGVSDLILDLRYNKGGTVDCAQLLASMIVPSSNLGSTFVKLYHATEQSSKDKSLTFDNSLIGSGANLNLTRIFIITTSATRQMSELLIASLTPYMSVYTIGTTTGGYVGVYEQFPCTRHSYTLNLLTCVGTNSKDETYTTSGIGASKSATDLTPLTTLLDFGNVNETMLAVALKLIAGE